ERFPLLQAELDVVAANIAYQAAERFGDFTNLMDALDLQRAALAVFEETGAAALVADTPWQHALTLLAVATREAETERLDEAITVLAALAENPRVKASPQLAASIAFQASRAHAFLAIRRTDEAALRDAIDGLAGAMDKAAPDDLQTRTTIYAETGKA